jgi:hypothetical protein
LDLKFALSPIQQAGEPSTLGDPQD